MLQRIFDPQGSMFMLFAR